MMESNVEAALVDLLAGDAVVTVDAVKGIVGPVPVDVPVVTGPAVVLESYDILIAKVGT